MIKELSSFRDPDSKLQFDDEYYYRKISNEYLTHYNHFKTSGLKDFFLNHNYILPFEEVIEEDQGSDYYAKEVLKTRIIPFVSYPYEWSFSQFKIAALFTLKINLIALEYGMVLKDASMFNVQFMGSMPFFIDIASFEIYEKDKPWKAYYQFCKHFYAPLFIAAKTNLFLPKLLLYFIEGIPLKEAVSLCRIIHFFNIGSFLHLYLHSKGENKVVRNGVEKKVDKTQLVNILKHLQSSIEKLTPKHKVTTWDDYNQNNNYFDYSKLDKASIIEGFLKQISCKTALDIGANDGFYSKIYADKGIYTLVVDIDEFAIDRAFIENHKIQSVRIHPLQINLVNPTPAIGWNNVERKSFWERCKVDVIQALAVVHHLAITHDIPLEEIANKFSQHTKYLIIEFVYPEDSQTQILLKNKPHHCKDYSQLNFEIDFEKFFFLREKLNIKGMKRDLYFYERK